MSILLKQTIRISGKEYGPSNGALSFGVPFESDLVTRGVASWVTKPETSGANPLSLAETAALRLRGVTATPGAYLQFGANGYSKFLKWQARANERLFDCSPTHFFDPSAASSTGAGTYTNPFTTAAHLTAWVTSLSGALGGKILGFKRGTVTREPIIITGGGNRSQSFMIVPYGSADALPQIVLGTSVTSWVPTSQSPLVYKVPVTVNQEVYQNGARVPRISNTLAESALITAMLAYGAGCCGYASGYVYLYPGDNENPNMGQVEMTKGSGWDDLVDKPFRLMTKDGVDSGNVSIGGIVTRLSRGLGLNVIGQTASEPTYSPANCHVSWCAAMQTGVDDVLNAGSNAGFSLSGTSDEKRLLYSSVTNCYASYIQNNSVESFATSDFLVENNEGWQIGGNLWMEMFASCSYTTVRYNAGSGYAYPVINNNFSQTCAWVSAFYAPFSGGTPIDTTGTKNTGNLIYMNFARDPMLGGVRVNGGIGTKVHHNTFLYTNNHTSGDVTGTLLRAYSAPATTTIDASRNAVVQQTVNGSGKTAVLLSGSTGLTLTGDYNAYLTQASFTGTDGTNYYTIQAWRTAMTSTSFDQNSLYTNLMDSGYAAVYPTRYGVDYATGRPLNETTGNNTVTLRGKGASGLGYLRDITGAPMPTIGTIGCYA